MVVSPVIRWPPCAGMLPASVPCEGSEPRFQTQREKPPAPQTWKRSLAYARLPPPLPGSSMFLPTFLVPSTGYPSPPSIHCIRPLRCSQGTQRISLVLIIVLNKLCTLAILSEIILIILSYLPWILHQHSFYGSHT